MRLLVLSLALVGLGARLAACDGWVHTAIEGGGACARVLADGVFNTWFATLPTTQVYPRTVAQSAFQSAMCSPATRPGELGTSRGGVKNFGVYIGDSAFSFARSLEEAQRRHGTYRSTLCTAGSDIGQTAISTYSSWLDPNILNAYDECLVMAAAGLSMDAIISKDGNIITITLGYAKEDKGSVVFRRSAVNGPAFCKFLTDAQRPFKPGYVLTAGAGKHSIQCERLTNSTDKGPVSVVVATSAGTRRFDLPDLVPPTVEQRLNGRLDELEERMDLATSRLQETVAQLQKELAALVRTQQPPPPGASTAGGAGKKPIPRPRPRPRPTLRAPVPKRTAG